MMRAVDEYLAVRRAAGFALEVPEYLLRSYARFGDNRGETHVRAETVIEWASLAPSRNQRHHRLNTVRRFARHARVEDQRHEEVPSSVFGHRRSRRVPYIYADEQIRQLLQAASELGPPGSLRPHVYRTLFGLLFATGLRISEALALRYGDVTPDGLVIRKTKFKKSRLVPLHETTQVALEDYQRRRRRFAAGVPHLFVSVRGRTLDRSSVQWTFIRLLKTIGIDAAPKGRRPRIHDARHTFAVAVLQESPEDRESIGRHMLALTTYLGHSNIADTYWYLEATPHLLADIATRCESFVDTGGAP
ncbi:MAG: tyrosine-type recombinase/integrase [bacterium]|nr:tyrosine-type recombinase/integrase [bacterium]